ncbi:MAG: hypothetical protein QXT13_08565 [Pyrobaculum sp.]
MSSKTGRTEVRYRKIFTRGLEVYRKQLRKRTSELLREVLGIERLPRRLTFRDAREVIKAVIEGRRRVKFMYDWARKYKGDWFARKWAWYLRSKEYWREKFEELYRELERYYKLYEYVHRNPLRLAAEATAYVRGRQPTIEEKCAQYAKFGPFAEIFENQRSIIIYDNFLTFAKYIEQLWPQRRFRVTLAYRHYNPRAAIDAEDHGSYMRDVGYGKRPYMIYTYIVNGKDMIRFLKRVGYYDLDAMIVSSYDPVPTPMNCL